METHFGYPVYFTLALPFDDVDLEDTLLERRFIQLISAIVQQQFSLHWS